MVFFCAIADEARQAVAITKTKITFRIIGFELTRFPLRSLRALRENLLFHAKLAEIAKKNLNKHLPRIQNSVRIENLLDPLHDLKRRTIDGVVHVLSLYVADAVLA